MKSLGFLGKEKMNKEKLYTDSWLKNSLEHAQKEVDKWSKSQKVAYRVSEYADPETEKETMKFKVGDKVEIVSYTADYCKRFVGNLGTITRVIKDATRYPYKVDSIEPYWWEEDHLKLLTPTPEKETPEEEPEYKRKSLLNWKKK